MAQIERFSGKALVSLATTKRTKNGSSDPSDSLEELAIRASCGVAGDIRTMIRHSLHAAASGGSAFRERLFEHRAVGAECRPLALQPQRVARLLDRVDHDAAVASDSPAHGKGLAAEKPDAFVTLDQGVRPLVGRGKPTFVRLRLACGSRGASPRPSGLDGIHRDPDDRQNSSN